MDEGRYFVPEDNHKRDTCLVEMLAQMLVQMLVQMLDSGDLIQSIQYPCSLLAQNLTPYLEKCEKFVVRYYRLSSSLHPCINP